MSRTVIPPAERLMIISARPESRRLPFRTRVGVNDPSRSRGITRSTSPVWVATFLGVVPFPRVRHRRRGRVALPKAQMARELGLQTPLKGGHIRPGMNPPSQVSSISPESIYANSPSSAPDAASSAAAFDPGMSARSARRSAAAFL